MMCPDWGWCRHAYVVVHGAFLHLTFRNHLSMYSQSCWGNDQMPCSHLLSGQKLSSDLASQQGLQSFGTHMNPWDPMSLSKSVRLRTALIADQRCCTTVGHSSIWPCCEAAEEGPGLLGRSEWRHFTRCDLSCNSGDNGSVFLEWLLNYIIYNIFII